MIDTKLVTTFGYSLNKLCMNVCLSGLWALKKTPHFTGAQFSDEIKLIV